MQPSASWSEGVGQSASKTRVVAPPAEEEPEKPGGAKTKHLLCQPTGVLAVHVKRIQLVSLKLNSLFPQASHVTVYLRVVAGGLVKNTCAFVLQHVPSYLVVDEMRHFPMIVNNKKKTEENTLRIELVAFQSPTMHYLLAANELHLFELIKHLYVAETYTLIGRGKPVATVEVEFCFAYGSFGYGYSNQLENRQKEPQDQISHSLFCRLEPPASRSHEETPDVMSCLPVGHPSFINFTQKVSIGTTAREFGTDDELAEMKEVVEPTLLISRMRKKMYHLQQEYCRQTSRRGRLNFLKNVVNNDVLSKTIGREVFNVPKGFPMKKKVIRPAARPVEVDLGPVQSMPPSEEEDPGQEEMLITDISHAADVMSMMPGIARRRTSSLAPKFTSDELSDEETIAEQPRWLKKMMGTKVMMEAKGSLQGKEEGPVPKPIFGKGMKMRDLVKVLKESEKKAEGISGEPLDEKGQIGIKHVDASTSKDTEMKILSPPSISHTVHIISEKNAMESLVEVEDEELFEAIDDVPDMPSIPLTKLGDKQCKIEITVTSGSSLSDSSSTPKDVPEDIDKLGPEIHNVKSLLKRRLTWRLPEFLQRRFSWRRPSTVPEPLEGEPSNLSMSPSFISSAYNKAPRKSVFEAMSDKMQTILQGGLPHESRKFVIPRVMIDPPTPDVSESSESEDDDYYYDAD